MEPDLSSDVKAALLVTETGIVDSQALVDSLAREIEEADYLPSKDGAQHAVGSRGLRPEDRRGDGVLVLGTRIVRIDREEKGTGWIVQMETGWEGREEGEKGEVESVRCEVVVNAAGLGATMLQEGVVPENERIKMYPVKGKWKSRYISTQIVTPEHSLMARQLRCLQGTRRLKRIATDLSLSGRWSRSSRHTSGELR